MVSAFRPSHWDPDWVSNISHLISSNRHLPRIEAGLGCLGYASPDIFSCFHQSILVELESSDLEVLNDINNKWTQNSFGDNFVCWAKYNHERTNKLFALTTQQNNFNKLQADSILG